MVFHESLPLRLTIDSGAECNLISLPVAKFTQAKIEKTTYTAVQADGRTPLLIIGETRLVVTRGDIEMYLDALVVETLEVDVLAGMLFLEINDECLQPGRSEISVQHKTFMYKQRWTDGKMSPVRRAHIELLRAPPSSSIV